MARLGARPGPSTTMLECRRMTGCEFPELCFPFFVEFIVAASLAMTGAKVKPEIRHRSAQPVPGVATFPHERILMLRSLALNERLLYCLRHT